MQTDWISSSPGDSEAFSLCAVISFVVHMWLNPVNVSTEINIYLLCFVHHSLSKTFDLPDSCLFIPSLFADLNYIPTDLPSDIVKMDLSRNSIKHLRPKHFLLSKDLKLLNLSGNGLQHIDKGDATAPPSQQRDTCF